MRVLGVGFGPSNLALAAVARERWEAGISVPAIRFIDARRQFNWHPGMLLPGTTMQSCFLEDLVTYRNPSSRFSFLAYLHEKNRLFEYVNLRRFYSTRVEFNDYLAWVAAQVGDCVRYGWSVQDVAPGARGGGGVDELRVTAVENGTGRVVEERCEALVLGTGGVPYVPAGIDTAGRRLIHSHHFLDRFPALFANKAARYRFLVVGAGQSAAELVWYLHQQYQNAEIHAVLRQFSFKPMDDSCFLNEIFDPAKVDMIYDFPRERQRLLDAAYAGSNYARVSPDLITALYRAIYDERVSGRNRVRFLAFTELSGLRESGERAEAALRSLETNRTTEESFDAAVLCTGYHRTGSHPLLKKLSDHISRTDDGEYEIARTYRVRTVPTMSARVYIQGWNERSHGVGDSLIPILPTRSAEILDDLVPDRAAAIPQPPRSTGERTGLGEKTVQCL